MGVFFHYRAHDIGVNPLTEEKTGSDTQGLTKAAKAKIASMGLVHRAGNIYECPSTQDFWKVQGNSIKKLVGNEVDNDEAIPAAPEDRPMKFIESILDALEF